MSDAAGASSSIASRSVDVMAHALSRSAAIASLELAGGGGGGGGNGGVGVVLARHLRRRTTSHKRKRTRSTAPDVVVKDVAIVAVAAAASMPRVVRRRPASRRVAWEEELIMAALPAAPGVAASGRWRLATHDWHAKRFIMGVLPAWGSLNLPFARTDVGVRAVLSWWWRSSRPPGTPAAVAAHPSPSCVVHDASYWVPVRLTGGEGAIARSLAQVLDPHQTNPCSTTSAAEGNDEGSSGAPLTAAQRSRRRRLSARHKWHTTTDQGIKAQAWPPESATSPSARTGAVAIRAWLFNRSGFPNYPIAPAIIHWLPSLSTAAAASRDCVVLVHAAGAPAALSQLAQVVTMHGVAVKVESLVCRFSFWGGDATRAATAALGSLESFVSAVPAPPSDRVARATYSEGSGINVQARAAALWLGGPLAEPVANRFFFGVKRARDEEEGESTSTPPTPAPAPIPTSTPGLRLEWGGGGQRVRIDVFVPRSSGRHAWGRAIRVGGAAAVGLREWRAIHAAAHIPHFPSDACDTPAGQEWASSRAASLVSTGRARGQARIRAAASTAAPPHWPVLWTEPARASLPIALVRCRTLARGVLTSCAQGAAPSRSRTLIMASFVLPSRGRPPPAGSHVSLTVGGPPVGFVLSAVHSPSAGGRATGIAALRAEAAASLSNGKDAWLDAIVCGYALRIVALLDDRGE